MHKEKGSEIWAFDWLQHRLSTDQSNNSINIYMKKLITDGVPGKYN